MKPPLRLVGANTDVTTIGVEAVAALRADPQAASALFSRLWKLHMRRRRFVTSAGVSPVSPSAQAPVPAAGAGYRSIWGVLLGIGLAAALASAVMLGPADRRNSFTDPALAFSIALVAGLIAIPALLIVLMLRVPDSKSARTGETLTVLVGILCVGMLLYRLVMGGGDGRGFEEQDLVAWLPMTALIVLLMAGVVIRADIVRRRSAEISSAVPEQTKRAEIREMHREAEWAASSERPSAPMKADWGRRLDALGERRIDPASVAQARTMTPAAWLTWLAYDGEIDLTDVIPRP